MSEICYCSGVGLNIISFLMPNLDELITLIAFKSKLLDQFTDCVDVGTVSALAEKVEVYMYVIWTATQPCKLSR